VALWAGVEGVDESLKGDKETFDFLEREGAAVAELRAEARWEVDGVVVGGGANEGVIATRLSFEVEPEAVAAMRCAGGPGGGGEAALAQATFEHFPSVVASERCFVEPEPGEVEAAGVVGASRERKRTSAPLARMRWPVVLEYVAIYSGGSSSKKVRWVASRSMGYVGAPIRPREPGSLCARRMARTAPAVVLPAPIPPTYKENRAEVVTNAVCGAFKHHVWWRRALAGCGGMLGRVSSSSSVSWSSALLGNLTFRMVM
jgi:hypothetical protein